ncbi:hypothetical protein DFJ74DRAFT_709863 [Hyaloraphidium curvatum]|nr:hypothetical protein DFJ74DRAFT_709863 [Hyaloraphidium curvatum]
MQTLLVEILDLILSCDAVSLAELYHLRRCCRSVGAAASRAFRRRMKYVLALSKDSDAFLDFVQAVRGPEPEDFGLAPLDPRMDPRILGRMMADAGLPVEERDELSRPGTRGELLAGMGATPAELALVARNLGYSTNAGHEHEHGHVMRMRIMSGFLHGYGWPSKASGEVALRALDYFPALSIADRWSIIFSVERWIAADRRDPDPELLDEFVRDCLPRLVDYARNHMRKPDSLDDASITRYVVAEILGKVSTGYIAGALLARSNDPLFPDPNAVLDATYDFIHCINVIWCYTRLRTEEPGPLAVGPEDSRRLFSQIG